VRGHIENRRTPEDYSLSGVGREGMLQKASAAAWEEHWDAVLSNKMWSTSKR